MLTAVLCHRAEWIVFLLVALISTVAPAQEVPAAQEASKVAPQVERTLPTYEGQKVTTVELAGQPDLNVDELAPSVSLKPGDRFSQAKVDETIAALNSTGRFKQVELEVRPEAEGVRVLFVLQPAIYFGMYHFPGAVSRFSYSRLLQVANYPPRGAYTSVDVTQARDSVEKFLQRSGYFQAKVNTEIQTDQVHGIADVIFHVNLGRRAKFGSVIIDGTSPQEAKRLIDRLQSTRARLRNSAIRPGKTYKLHTVENASQFLENTLIKQRHLGAKVKLHDAEFDPATNRADVRFDVDPGPVIKVDVKGAHLWSWTKRRLLPIYAGIGIDPELIQEGRQNLASHFQSKGFFNVDVRVDVKEKPNGQDVVYQVTRGPRHKVSDVKLAGNKTIDDSDLMSNVAVRQARFLSRGRFSDQLVKSSIANLRRVYRSEGFSDVQITPQVTNKNGNIAVTFFVNEGQRDYVDSLDIVGNSVPISNLAPQGLRLAPGQPYSQKRADQDRNQIVAQYLRAGFLNVSFRVAAEQAGKDKHRLRVTYQIAEGPRVTTASVVSLGHSVTDPKLIAKFIHIPVGKPMREDEMLLSENGLFKLGIFDWAEISPRRQITTQTDEDVLVKVHEAKQNVLTYGIGFEVVNRGGSVPSGTVAVPGLPPIGLPSNFQTSESTFWGPRGNFDYTRKNFRGEAESLSFAALAGRLDQRGSANYADPVFLGSNWSTNLALTAEHNTQNPIFSFVQEAVGYQFHRPVSRDKTQTVFLQYNFQITNITDLLIPDLVPPSNLYVRLSTISGSYTRDTRDNALDAHKGIYETLQIDLNPLFLGSNFSFARLLGQTAYYKNIGAGIIWANSARLGLEQPLDDSEVPISEAFFSGGGSTLRGFPLNGAGPQRPVQACGTPGVQSTCSLITVPVGGNQLFIVNSEFRIPVPITKGFGVVGFYDGGNVYQTIGFHDFWGNYTNSVGIGFRYATPVGPIRFDIGHNLNAPPGIKSTQYFITLGQAF